MPRAFRSLFSTIRSLVVEQPPQPTERSSGAQRERNASIDRLVRAIDRSLDLAGTASTPRVRETNLGIARMNFNSLRALTSDDEPGARADVQRLTHAFTQPDPWRFADERVAVRRRR